MSHCKNHIKQKSMHILFFVLYMYQSFWSLPVFHFSVSAVRHWLERKQIQTKTELQCPNFVTSPEVSVRSPKRSHCASSSSKSACEDLPVMQNQALCYKKRKMSPSCLPLVKPLSPLVYGNGIVSRRRLPRVRSRHFFKNSEYLF